MPHDHHVRFASDYSIARLTASFRDRMGIGGRARFDIVAIVEALKKSNIPGKGYLSVVPLTEGETEPYVSFKPLQLHIHDEMLESARWDDPEAIYKIAHEISHIILHDHYASPFSIDPTVQIRYGQNEDSAEWQANRFAYHLLLPDWLVRQLHFDVDAIVEATGVERRFATDRIAELAK